MLLSDTRARQLLSATPHPGVHRLRIPLAGSPLQHLNAYVLPGREGHLLIDTGWNRDDAFEALQGQMEALGLSLGDVSTIVLTHMHLDHCGLVERVRRASGAVVGIHAVESRLMGRSHHQVRDYAHRTAERLRQSGMEDGVGGVPEEVVRRMRSLAAPFEADFTLEEGQVLQHDDFALRVVWTPGHSPGHMCLYEAGRRLLFAGDHVLERITPNVGLFPHSGGNPLGSYLASLEKLESLGVDLVLPGHGEPFRGLVGRARELKEHHAFRGRELMELLAQEGGRQTPFKLAQLTTWHSGGRPVSWQRLPALDQRLAIFETMAHLEAMSRDGALRRWEESGVVSYSLG